MESFVLNPYLSYYLKRANRLTISTYLLGAQMKELSGYDYDAIIFWNKILTDDKTNVTTAFAYLSRAKIFYGRGFYRTALRDIKRAEAHGMPSRKLEQIKFNCQNYSGLEPQRIDRNEFLNLKQLTGTKRPWKSDCLKLRRDSQMKPYIITDKQLNIGDVICYEQAAITISYGRDHPSKLVETDLVHKRCHNCLKDILELIPCPNCDSAMFCSKTCQINANLRYHNYECIINTVLHGVELVVNLMRPFFCALSCFRHNIDELKSFILSRNNVKKTIFDCEFPGSTLNFLHILDSFDAPIRTDLSADLPAIFNAYPVLACMWPLHHNFLVPYLNRQANILCHIGRDLFQWPGHAEPALNGDSMKMPLDLIRLQKVVGHVTFLLAPLMSQSCQPNIYRHHQGNEMHYIVIRNINKGDKLTISNKDSLFFARLSDAERLQHLKKEFNFICTNNDCPEAARSSSMINQWNDDEFNELPGEIGRCLYYWNQDKARFAYLTMIDYLKNNHSTMSPKEFLFKLKKALLFLEFSSRPTLPFKSDPSSPQ